ncbi:hypothetical protein AB0K48_11490 [Nonomuraea sp. NPDC055795]
MFTVELTCPGSRDNAVTIKTDLDLNRGGLDTISNSGTCPLFIGSLDASGNVLNDLEVRPQESVSHYQPPAGATRIYAVCNNACDGFAVLTYDDPDLRS